MTEPAYNRRMADDDRIMQAFMDMLADNTPDEDIRCRALVDMIAAAISEIASDTPCCGVRGDCHVILAVDQSSPDYIPLALSYAEGDPDGKPTVFTGSPEVALDLLEQLDHDSDAVTAALEEISANETLLICLVQDEVYVLTVDRAAWEGHASDNN